MPIKLFRLLAFLGSCALVACIRFDEDCKKCEGITYYGSLVRNLGESDYSPAYALMDMNEVFLVVSYHHPGRVRNSTPFTINATCGCPFSKVSIRADRRMRIDTSVVEPGVDLVESPVRERISIPWSTDSPMVFLDDIILFNDSLRFSCGLNKFMLSITDSKGVEYQDEVAFTVSYPGCVP